MSRYQIPKEIEEIIGQQDYSVIDVGMSESEVRIYEHYVLKIQPKSEETDNEYLMINWVGNRLPIPSIVAYCVTENSAFTLMTKINGEMLCSVDYLNQPKLLIRLAAQGLKRFWSVDINDCPYKTSRLNERLKAAEYNVLHDLVDTSHAESETFGPNGFSDPRELLEWLENNRPEEDLVLTHGDFCLPNILVKEKRISGFIDLGKMGPADRWQDIAVAIRSLSHNFDGKYTDGKKVFDFKPQMFLDELDIPFNEGKYRYYILLDELF